MNGVLLIPCVGPMQSWGTRSRFQERDTEREPTKSGIVGMLCAALGRDRSEPVDDLAALLMGVRVDRGGKLVKDFQTAQNVAVASGSSPQDLLSNRYYLSDAAFLVGLEGPIAFLQELHVALRKPVWPLFLGRKSYVHSEPPYLSDGLVVGASLKEALYGYPLMISVGELKRRKEGRGDGELVRFIFESREPTPETRNDQPRSFALGKRSFGQRYVLTTSESVEAFPLKGGEDVSDSALP